MEDIGRLLSRYYVKISGIFSKNTKLLQIYEQGIVLQNPKSSKVIKGKHVCLFRNSCEFQPSPHEKEIIIKAGKQNYTIICTDRLNLLTDLYSAQVNSIFKNSLGFIRYNLRQWSRR